MRIIIIIIIIIILFIQVMLLWETIWVGHRSHNFELFLILAINDIYAAPLVHGRSVDNVLEFFVKLSMRMDVHRVLARARKACVSYGCMYASSTLVSVRVQTARCRDSH
jgi:hypothetical protein